MKQATTTSGACNPRLEILFQIHPAIQAGDLIAIAIEHEGWTLGEFPQPALSGLAPARMIHIRIHVGIKAVFSRSRQTPAVDRLLVGEMNAHDCFRALEA